MVHASLIRKNAAGILKSILPQSAAVVGICCLFSLLGNFFGQMLSLFLPLAARTAAIEIVSAVFEVFLLTPLMLGIQRWTWRLTGGADDSLRTVFRYFGDGKNYRRALGFSLHFHLRLYAIRLASLPMLWLERTNAFGSDSVIFFDLSGGWSDVVPVWLAAGAGLLSLASTFFFAWLSFRYFLAPYLLINDESLSPRAALGLSFKIMWQRVGGLLGFSLGFIGWILLCILILPMLYVLPLIWLSMAIYARYLLADYNQGFVSAYFPREV